MTGLDVAFIAAYAAGALAIGVLAGRGHHTSSDWLLGGRRLPAWAVLLSMVATELSAATFIGVPQAAYHGDWSYLQLAFGALLGKVVVATRVLPVYHAQRVATVYAFLEQRFGPRSRRTAALCFIGGRLLASGVRLFIAALAFSAATDLRIEISIALCGAVAGLYTSFGGIRAVVYTDVMQALVLCLGATAIAIAATSQAGGLDAVLSWGAASGRSQVFHTMPLFSLGDGRSLGAAVVGGFFLTLATHSTDHDMVQRLLTTRNARSAGRALLGSAVLNFPLTLLFLVIGSAMALAHATPPAYAVGESERILPLFVLHELPPGARGLVFAGLFAAAMSSLDSAICAISATFSVDVAPGGRAARRAVTSSAVLTLALVAIAIAMAHYQRATSAQGAGLDLIDLALSSMTILYGGLLGVFGVGLATGRRGTDASASRGLAVGAAAGAALFLQPVLLGETIIAWTWWIPISASLAAATVALQPRGAGRAPAPIPP